MSKVLSEKTEIEIADGDASISIYGEGSRFTLFFNREHVGNYLTYTEALNRAITIVNEIG